MDRIESFRNDSEKTLELVPRSTGREQEDDAKPAEITAHAVRTVSRKTIDDETGDIREVEVRYVEFAVGDPTNPFNFSRRRKWTITWTACAFTGFVASTASTYSVGYPSMTRDLGCNLQQAAGGLSLYALGFGVAPLVLASFSEEFGRRPMYLATGALFGLMYLPVALAPNIGTVWAARLISGAAGSTGATLVGGSIADIWHAEERGLPMSLFSVAALGATGLGPAIAGWIEQGVGWRWIQWLQIIIFGVFFPFFAYIMSETRGAVLLTREAKRLRAETGDDRYRARAEDERGSLSHLVYVSCTRPLHLLFTEPVVASFSLWIGFGWGVLYGLLQSLPLTFRLLYGFDQGRSSLFFLSITLGSLLGFLSNIYQEILYKKNAPTRGPEARLYSACAAAIFFPAGCFIYAGTSLESIHWIIPFIALTILMWAIFTIYLAVFSYLADCYSLYASSALAGQSLFRNLMGAAFPLFTDQMYRKLTFRYATIMFGSIATILLVVPYILFFFGPRIRARSKFASILVEARTS